jgi:hypothetical protein
VPDRAALGGFAPPGKKGDKQTGPHPTDRGKPRSKYHLVVDRNGIPLAVRLSAANVHDSTQRIPLIDAVPPIIGPRARAGRPRKRPGKLHGDKAYDSSMLRRAVRSRGSPHASRAAASTLPTGWGGTAGWSRARLPRCSVFAVWVSAMSAEPPCKGFLHLAYALICLTFLAPTPR